MLEKEHFSHSLQFIIPCISKELFKSLIISKPINLKNISEILSKEINSNLGKNEEFLIERDLKEKEFAVFNKLELKRAGKKLRFLILKIVNLDILPIKHISRVVNTLYLLYGEDDYGKGKFSEEDIDELNNNEAVWKGRSWLQTDRHLQPAMIRCDDNEGLKLFVMNV